MFKKIIDFFKPPKFETTVINPRRPRRNEYEVGKLYILISNNKENLSVAEYLGEEEYPNFTISLFRDVVSNEEHIAMCQCIAYTERRFLALSKLEWQEVVVLTYFLNEEWDVETAPTKDVYIDPMINYQNIMNAINAENK